MVNYVYIYIISYPLSFYAQSELTFFTTHSKLSSETLHTVPLWQVGDLVIAFHCQQLQLLLAHNNNSTETATTTTVAAFH